MSQHTYVFTMKLVDVKGVRRRIAVRGDLTLVDLHYAIQAAFGWDDDHHYAFWLGGRFWARDGDQYMPPRCAGTAKSALVPLDELALEVDQRIAYLFDFGAEWRVRLRLREIIPDDGRASPRLLHASGTPPPQYAAALQHAGPAA
ncbi:MAG: plasmid pRiA4b ORF-3 family protein [Solirubrobacteraceae bacterium]